jgi:hypothetical protein
MANRLKFTAKKKRQFINELAIDANVSRTCRLLGVSARAAYNQREKDTKFAIEWDKAIKIGVNVGLVSEAHRRAHSGVPEPIFHQGKLIGFKKVYSDALLMFLIKKHDPSYREKIDYNFSGEVSHKHSISDDLKSVLNDVYDTPTGS